jgi:hypothetical protein
LFGTLVKTAKQGYPYDPRGQDNDQERQPPA